MKSAKVKPDATGLLLHRGFPRKPRRATACPIPYSLVPSPSFHLALTPTFRIAPFSAFRI
jgi:hypothetical protein